MRASVHREPSGLVDTARHYLRDLIYGANDGIITTFAVVAGVTGGALSSRAVLVVGLANLFADGLSMGVGNYLSIRSDESAHNGRGGPNALAGGKVNLACGRLTFPRGKKWVARQLRRQPPHGGCVPEGHER